MLALSCTNTVNVSAQLHKATQTESIEWYPEHRDSTVAPTGLHDVIATPVRLHSTQKHK